MFRVYMWWWSIFHVVHGFTTWDITTNLESTATSCDRDSCSGCLTMCANIQTTFCSSLPQIGDENLLVCYDDGFVPSLPAPPTKGSCKYEPGGQAYVIPAEIRCAGTNGVIQEAVDVPCEGCTAYRIYCCTNVIANPDPPPPPPSTPPPPSVPPPPQTPELCLNVCAQYANDGLCFDGGEGSVANFCAYGTDCEDCGPRVKSPPPMPPLPPSPPPPFPLPPSPPLPVEPPPVFSPSLPPSPSPPSPPPDTSLLNTILIVAGIVVGGIVLLLLTYIITPERAEGLSIVFGLVMQLLGRGGGSTAPPPPSSGSTGGATGGNTKVASNGDRVIGTTGAPRPSTDKILSNVAKLVETQNIDIKIDRGGGAVPKKKKYTKPKPAVTLRQLSPESRNMTTSSGKSVVDILSKQNGDRVGVRRLLPKTPSRTPPKSSAQKVQNVDNIKETKKKDEKPKPDKRGLTSLGASPSLPTPPQVSLNRATNKPQKVVTIALQSSKTAVETPRVVRLKKTKD